MKQFGWLLCVAKNCDCLRKITPLSKLTLELNCEMFSNQFDIVSETHFSSDTVDRGLWLAILSSLLCPEKDRNICIGNKGYVVFFRF